LFPDDIVTGSNHTLMKQASDTAEIYLERAIRAIDEQLGKGFAEGHPELVVGFMQASATDYQASITARSLEKIANAIAGNTCALDRIGDNLGAVGS